MINNNKIKISIVLPVYNVESYIVQCLDSLINQTIKEIEIILINDYSSDNSGTICDEYAAKDSRIIVIHNENNIKQGASRNRGIEIAKGEYISFVDPDDWVDLDYFEKLYKSGKNNKSDIVKTESIKVFTDKTKKLQYILNNRIKKGIKNKLPIFLLFTFEHTTAIFKRDIIIKNKIRYPNIRNGEDIMFLLNVTYYSTTISLISGTNYYYRHHHESLVAVRKKPYFESKLFFFDLYLNFLNTHKMERIHYDIAFKKSFYSIIIRYKEMETIKVKADFKREYVKEALRIMSQYKYEGKYLLDSFYTGFTFDEEIQQLKNTITYRTGKVITWLPSKIKYLLKKPLIFI